MKVWESNEALGVRCNWERCTVLLVNFNAVLIVDCILFLVALIVEARKHEIPNSECCVVHP